MKYMNCFHRIRILSLFLCVSAICLITGCGIHQDVKLLEHASPETSSIGLYFYDGESTHVKYVYDSATEIKILNEINALPTIQVDASRVAEIATNSSLYGLWISDTDGYDLWLTYANSLWLCQDGSVYMADFDFKNLFDNILTNDADVMYGGIYMPNAGILCDYDLRFYMKSEELTNTKNQITLSVVQVYLPYVDVQIQNNADTEFLYGTYFSLQKEIDGTWYTLPVRLSNYAFNDIAMILPPGEAAIETCDLTMYGELTPGHYRIEKEKLVAEFIL